MTAEPVSPDSKGCRHCGGRYAYRPRGLCNRCYYSDVRKQYPVTGAHNRVGSGLGSKVNLNRAGERSRAMESLETIQPTYRGGCTPAAYGYTPEELAQLGDVWLPTTAAPGTAEKMLVMQQRASLNLPIFHPLDARGDTR